MSHIRTPACWNDSITGLQVSQYGIAYSGTDGRDLVYIPTCALMILQHFKQVTSSEARRRQESIYQLITLISAAYMK